jgi:hypothetical protein
MNGFQSGMDEDDWSMPNSSDAIMPGAFAPPDAGDGQIVELASRRPHLQLVSSSQGEDQKAQEQQRLVDMTPVVLPRAPDPSPYRQPTRAYPALPPSPKMASVAAIPLSALPHPSGMPRPMMPRMPARSVGTADIGYQPPSFEASNIDTSQRGHLLGVSTVAAGLGAVLGMRFGGIYGTVAGTLFAGAAVNGYRAALYGTQGNAVGKREAMISGTYALISAGLGGYLIYRMKKEGGGKATPNTSNSDDSCVTKNGRRSCGIRAIV